MDEQPQPGDAAVVNRDDRINAAFRQFVKAQADAMIDNHQCVRGAALVAIDGNGYVSIASFALSKTGTEILLADALQLSRTQQPDVETSAPSRPDGALLEDAANEVPPPPAS